MSKVLKAPKFGEIITARPKGMDYQEYRRRLRKQNKRLKLRLNGFWAWECKDGTLIGPVPEIRIR